MTELEQALELLEKAKENNGREPDKCLIYIEKAQKEIRDHERKLDQEIPF